MSSGMAYKQKTSYQWVKELDKGVKALQITGNCTIKVYFMDLTTVFMSVMGTSFKNCRLK